MPGWFSGLFSSNNDESNAPDYQYCTTSRNAFRIAAGAGLVGTAVSNVTSPAASLPFTFAQMLTASATFFRKGLTKTERAVHAINASLSTAIFIFTSITYGFGEDCEEDPSSNLCIWAIYVQLLYVGFLSLNWLVSERLNSNNPPSYSLSLDDYEQYLTEQLRTALENQGAVTINRALNLVTITDQSLTEVIHKAITSAKTQASSVSINIDHDNSMDR